MSLLSRASLLLLSLLLTFTTAQSSNNASAVFVYNGSDNTEFIFALNADKSTGDLYFHLSSPAGNAWVGVGIGDQMKDALMFIAYPAGNDKDVTISPRIGSGHTEPEYQSDLKLDLQSGKGLTGANTVSGNSRETKNIIADGVCRGCAKWDRGSIDLTNKKQPFILAVGPVFPAIASNSQSAGLTRHMFYGHFTMDMTAATSNSGGAVPLGPYKTKSASNTATSTKMDNDPAPRIHGAVMSVVFVIAFPLGTLMLRVWHKVKGHIAVQVVGLVLFCMAFAGGSVVSTQYNRSKHFNSAHQVIGILLLIALFAQLGLGAYHHKVYMKTQQKTIFGKIHTYLGPAIMLIGILNGFLGFRLAGAYFLAIPYSIILIVFAGIYLCIRGYSHIRRRRNASKNAPEGYQYPHFGAPPPQYGPPFGAPPPYAQPDVPLQRFESSQSVPRADSPAVQPRTMV
ncbi:uncharacterized protein LTR77_008615 [Saxophila tyrrhenica]|uniref:DOMON domain-containing protein n=1 Tax=Saxophila tyrrhenica TaxID=1690608 RepID=A0AAV9NZV9_9PEZI|nr:hypothetical protein LTR77_008615 [Saxophila tyrrhenica]